MELGDRSPRSLSIILNISFCWSLKELYLCLRSNNRTIRFARRSSLSLVFLAFRKTVRSLRLFLRFDLYEILFSINAVSNSIFFHSLENPNLINSFLTFFSLMSATASLIEAPNGLVSRNLRKIKKMPSIKEM